MISWRQQNDTIEKERTKSHRYIPSSTTTKTTNKRLYFELTRSLLSSRDMTGRPARQLCKKGHIDHQSIHHRSIYRFLSIKIGDLKFVVSFFLD